MNDLPRHTLSRIIAKHGRGICDEPKRLEALLRDYSGAYRREINIITGALEERVPADLIAAGNTTPREVLFARLAARLRDNLAYTPEAARWGVEAWAVALGVLSEAELQERARKESAKAGLNNAPSPIRDRTPPMENMGGSAGSRQAPQPQRGTGNSPAQQPSPKTSRQPPLVRPPAHTPQPVPVRQPNITVQGPPRQNISPPPTSSQTRRRGLTWRGCLILTVLAVVLIITAVLVVPAVIMILQEEQARPSINEPRIR